MQKKPKKKKKYLRQRPGRNESDLGRITAENDELLHYYYVGHDKFLRRALDRDDPASVFIGPKGSGKSAVLKMVLLDQKASGDAERCIEIRPDDLAFSYLFTGTS